MSMTILGLALLAGLNPTDMAYITIERAFAEAESQKNRQAILCLHPKLVLARKLITRYNSRELSGFTEQSIASDLEALSRSARRCQGTSATGVRSLRAP